MKNDIQQNLALDGLIKDLQVFIELSFQEDETSLKEWINETINKLDSRCWKSKKCSEGNCPAYKNECGRCWLIAGTMCGGRPQGKFIEKYGFCTECEIYQDAIGDDRIRRLRELVIVLIHSLRLKQFELKKTQNELEERVQERTVELEQKTLSLEESNIALKVIMKQQEEVKKELEKNLLFNVKKLIKPSLEKLKKNNSDKNQKLYLDVIEANLNDIISPFAPGVTDNLTKLTPAEIHIADLIRTGKTTKEIANLLSLSPTTIATHRQAIRKKLDLANKKMNLRTILSTKQ